MLATWLALGQLGCQNSSSDPTQTEPAPSTSRIVSLGGTLSEILVELGLESSLVGVDVTTTYPTSLNSLPKVGHVRNLSLEGLLSTEPDQIIGFDGEVTPQLQQQLEQAGATLHLVPREYTVEGLGKTVEAVGQAVGKEEEAKKLIEKINEDMENAPQLTQPERILFIYARGAGTLMVAGKNTAADAMIQLIGGVNAVEAFEDFRPLTSEAVVSANPGTILMFDSGLESLGGDTGIQDIPGVSLTDAGKLNRIVTMDGQLMLGFGPRLAEAVQQLVNQINAQS